MRTPFGYYIEKCIENVFLNKYFIQYFYEYDIQHTYIIINMTAQQMEILKQA